MPRFSQICVALLAAALATAAPFSARNNNCTVKSQRRAWHTYSDDEKLAYIDAELCLMARPATLGLLGAQTRFDELQATHQIQASVTHGVGAFLPFHRLLMHAHEYVLQKECGYNGTQPYWNETLDAGKFSSSIVLDPVTGFGGDGRKSDGCITDGPFMNYTNHLGPGFNITDHCIDRYISDSFSREASQAAVDECNTNSNFSTAWHCLEGKPHAAGHGGIGGEMLNPISSPGDPIFYLHHTWLDKLFWDWQALDLPARLTDIAGPLVQDPNEGFPEIPGPDNLGPSNRPPPPPQTLRFKRDGDPGNVTTLSHVLNMFGVIPNATIGDVMDIAGGLLCYEYI